MNYYEELGVRRSASIAEIRQAYKALVRVLHPDQQQEENLRRLSELQLRRLNDMLQVLSDPLQRRQYDLSLDGLLPVRMQPELPQKVSLPELRGVWLHFKAGAFVWMLIAAIAIGTGIFWMRSPEPAYSESMRLSKEKPVEPVRKASPPAEISDKSHLVQEPAESAATVSRDPMGTPSKESSNPDRSGRAENLQQRASVVPTADVPTPGYYEQEVALATARNDKAPASPVKPNLESAASPITVLSTVVEPVEPLPGLSPAIPRKHEYSMSGKWLYVARQDDTKKGLYPPEYIEMRVTRSAGLLKGRYHALYKINDRPLSSEVNFQFEGRQAVPVAVLPWFSSNGSRGELRLKRISDDSLEVNWITTTFGNTNALASGTAVLYRSDP